MKSEPCGIRTHDNLIKSQRVYPPICLNCGSELSDDNWALRCRSKSYYKCRGCDTAERRIQYKNKRQVAGFQVKPHKRGNSVCMRCGVELTNNNWYACYKKSKRYFCIDCDRTKAKETNRQVRSEVIDAYGGKCVQCGIDNPLLLHIDHINNDGYKDRSLGRFAITLYRWLKANGYPKDNYQLLCKNCNWLKYLASIKTTPTSFNIIKQNPLEINHIRVLQSAHKLTQGGRNENAGGGC